MSIRDRSTWARSIVLILVGIAAGTLLSGPAVAHTGKRIPHLQGHLDPIYLNENQKAADANQLDGLDSTQFLRSNGKATDSELLDGVNSTGFLLVGGKAADANLLDGADSTAFVKFASVLTGTASCPGAGFDPENGSLAYTTASNGERYGPANTYRCAIDLPNGATVTGFPSLLTTSPPPGSSPTAH